MSRGTLKSTGGQATRTSSSSTRRSSPLAWAWHDTAADLQAKLLDFLRAGVRLVWVVYPTTQTVMRYQPHVDSRLYRPGDTLSGDPVLPGFTLTLSELFGD